MKRYILISVGVVVLVGALVGGAIIAWKLRLQDDSYYTDADTIRTPAEAIDPRDILWQPAIHLPANVNSSSPEFEPEMSPDGRRIYFASGAPGEQTNIYYCVRTPQGWSERRALDVINSRGDDFAPELSADGTKLYFTSNRPGGLGEYDIWMSERAADGWQAPVNLGPMVNTAFDETGPAVTPDGATLYFASNRPANGADAPAGHTDLYSAPADDRTIRHAEPVVDLNTDANESAPAVSESGDFLYFASDREGGRGGFDIYRSRVLPDRIAAPVNLGEAINTEAHEIDPTISLGGFGLHFASDRPVGAAGDESALYDVYFSQSREVFREDAFTRASIDWWDIWNTIWPLLLLLLGTLLAIWLLSKLLRGDRFRTLGLLARCLVASLILHLILLAVMTVMEVGSSLSDMMRDGGSHRVILTSASSGDSISAQIRGGATTVTVEAPLESSSQQQAIEMPVQPANEQSANLEVEPTETPAEHTPMIDAVANESQAEAAQLEQTSEMAATDVAQAAPVAVSLPNAAQAQAHAEPAQSTAEAAASAAESQQSEAAASASEAMTASDPSAALNPAANSAAIDQSSSESVATEATARDASPEMARDAGGATAVAQAPDAISLDLPSLPAQSSSGAAEAQGDVTGTLPATGGAAARAEASTAQEMASSATAITNMAPSQSSATSATSLASDATAVESAPESNSTNVLASVPAVEVGGIPSSVQSLDVALPASQGAAASETESATGVEAAIAQGALAAPAASSLEVALPGDPAAAVSEFAPVETAHASQGGSLAHDAAAEAADSDLQSSEQPVETGAGQVMAPEAMEIAVRLPGASATPLEENAEPSMAEHAAESATMQQASMSREGGAPAPAAAMVETAPTSEPRMFENESIEGIIEELNAAPDMNAQTPEDMVPAMVAVAMDVDLPLELPQDVMSEHYLQRSEAVREEIIDDMGGSQQTEEAVANALKWLADHQSQDGRWDGDGFDDDGGDSWGHARFKSDNALTGLALLCFLGADHTHLGDTEYQDTVERGVNWLISRQDTDGSFIGDESMYSHGIATIAVSEAYGMTMDPRLAEPVQRAINFIYAARNTDVGGWRYAPGQAGDTSVLGWQIMALMSARRAGLDVPDDAFEVAGDWLDVVSSRSQPGLYAYRPRERPTPAMTAEGMFTQQLLGLDRNHRRNRQSASYITGHMPDWDLDANTYYWYYATLALFQHQGDPWEQWNEAVKDQLLENQRDDGGAAGSWDPVGRWASIGGRVYQTSICTLTLEVYYRYLPLYLEDQ